MSNQWLIQYLKEMEKDEAKAPGDYQKIIDLVPNAMDRKRLRKIQSDERRHYRIVKSLLRKYS